jgi:hypothetical protein
VVDAWAGSVYTKKEFSNVNEKLYYYGSTASCSGVFFMCPVGSLYLRGLLPT